MPKKEQYEVVIEIACQVDFDGEYAIAKVDDLSLAKDIAGRMALFVKQTVLQMDMGVLDEEDGIIEVYVRRTSDEQIIHREAL